MTVRIDLNQLCQKCLIAAWERPTRDLAFLGYFMFAAREELLGAGIANPSIEECKEVALTAAAEFVMSLRTDVGRDLTHARMIAECDFADEVSEERIREAMDRILEHNDTGPYINVPKQLVN